MNINEGYVSEKPDSESYLFRYYFLRLITVLYLKKGSILVNFLTILNHHVIPFLTYLCTS